MMKLMKVLVLSVALSLVGGVVHAAQANSTLNAAKALEMARQVVPSTSQHIATESDNDDYEIQFYNKQSKEKFEIEINKNLQQIVKFKSERSDDYGSRKVVLSIADARKIAEKEVDSSAIKSIVLDQDGNKKEYDVTIRTQTYYGKMEINPETGAIMEREYKVSNKGTSVSSNEYKYLISYAKAKEIALTKVPGAVVTDIELEKQGKLFVYEVEMYHSGIEYELTINAKTGAGIDVRKHKVDWDYGKDDQAWNPDNVDHECWEQVTTASDKLICTDRAQQIALNKAQGGKITSLELDEDDGRLIYEGEIVKANREYEFKIDAYSGTILHWEADDIDD